MKKPSTFVGLDVHSTSIALAVWRPDADKSESREIPNDPKIIRRTFTRLQSEGPLRCCYEAGPCGFELYRQLTAMGMCVSDSLNLEDLAKACEEDGRWEFMVVGLPLRLPGATGSPWNPIAIF